MYSVKKVFLEFSLNSQENTCASLFFNKVAGLPATLLKKETLAQVFSYEFYENSKNTSGGCFWNYRKDLTILPIDLINWSNY